MGGTRPTSPTHFANDGSTPQRRFGGTGCSTSPREASSRRFVSHPTTTTPKKKSRRSSRQLPNSSRQAHLGNRNLTDCPRGSARMAVILNEIIYPRRPFMLKLAQFSAL